jgi:hypothetical protein
MCFSFFVCLCSFTNLILAKYACKYIQLLLLFINMLYLLSNTLKILKLVLCILLRVLGQVQGFLLTQHWFEYFIQ